MLSKNKNVDNRKFLLKKMPIFLKRFKLLIKDKSITENFKKILEFLGIKPVSNIEEEKDESLVICDKNNQKYIKKMKSDGIACYSKEILYDGLNSNELNLEKYKKIDIDTE